MTTSIWPRLAHRKVLSNDSEVSLIGFASNAIRNADAFVVINLGEEAKELEIEVWGSDSGSFAACRSSEDECYVSLGAFDASGKFAYQAPPRSVTTFFGN